MRTADLIDSLATDVRAVGRPNPLVQLSRATALGAAVSLLAVVLALGVQPGLLSDTRMIPFAGKAAYALALGSVALAAAVKLARPDGEFRAWPVLAAPVGALAFAAAWRLATVPDGATDAALLGGSWDRCPWRIAALSLPVMAFLFAAVRRQAPTDLRRAGAAIGLASGATAAIVYALACTENSPAFVLIWYSLGIALATLAGALLGPRLLRW